MTEKVFLLGCAAVVLFILVVLIRTGHFLRALFFSAITGNVALFAVAYAGAFTGTLLLPNVFTVGVSTLLGIPGVLAMLLVKMLLA